MSLLVTYIIYLPTILLITLLIGVLVNVQLFQKIENIDAPFISYALMSGTSTIVLITNILSNFGFDIRTISYVLVIFVIFLTVLSWKKIWRLKVWRNDLINIFLLFAISLFGASIIIMPILTGDSYVIIGDTYTYISISEYLQTHGIRPFLTEKDIVNFPYLSQTFIYQHGNFRIGAIWILSLIQNIIKKDAVYALPLATAWGFVLCSTTIFLFINKLVRRTKAKYLYLLIFNAIGNPILSSALTGFLPQTFGIAGFIMCTYNAEDFIDTDNRFSTLIAIYFSYLTSVYSELIPFTLIIFTIVCFIVLYNRWKLNPSLVNIKAILIKISLFVFAWIAFSNIDFMRFINSISKQINAVVGWDISLTSMEWLSFLFGFRGSGIELLPISYSIQFVLCLAGIVLVGAYLVKALLIRSIPITVFTIICVFLVFLVYFSLQKNPWTGELGQTWSIYKLIQWFYGGVFIIQVTAIEEFSTMLLKKIKYIPVIILVMICCSVYIPNLVKNINVINDRNNEIFLSQSPLSDLNEFVSEVKDFEHENNKIIFLISEKSYLWPRVIYTYFLRDFVVVSDWNDISYFPPILQRFRPTIQIDNTICILVERSTSIGNYTIIQQLPANTAIIECSIELIGGNSSNSLY